MISAEGLLILTIILILILLLFQKISFRIFFSELLTVEIEYFPIKLILYNFKRRKKPTKRLKKKIKRFFNLSIPITKSALKFFKRAEIRLYDLNLLNDSGAPHIQAFKSTFNDALESYLSAFLYSLFKFSAVNSEESDSKRSSIVSFDFEITARFYNLIFSFFVFIFFLIKNKGRNQKIVG
jgi:hypothetical protein